MENINGQISLFDFLETIPDAAPVLLYPGQKLYLVKKGDIEKLTVSNEKSYLCSKNNRGYVLQYDNGLYNIALNSHIGKNIFFSQDDAIFKAEEYLATHQVIRKENIYPVKTIAYQYVRNIDQHVMTAFYSELDNGMIYIKEFMTFHHLINANNKQKAIKKFMEQQEFSHDKVRQIEYQPIFKNMYLINQNYEWDYAEANHSFATG